MTEPIPAPRPLPLPLSRAVQSFLIYCESRNLSPRTVEFYSDKLRDCTGLLRDPSVHEVTTDQLRRLVVYWAKEHKRCPHLPPKDRGTGLAPNTINGYIRSLRAFFGFLTEEGILEENPAARLQLVKCPQYGGNTLTLGDVQRILRWSNGTSYHFKRNKALCVLLLDTGIRVGEVVGLTIQDVAWSERTLTVFGKGRKVRTVPFGRQTGRALSSYLAVHPSSDCLDAAFFVTANGDPLSVWRARHIVGVSARRAGIVSKSVSPHVLRRTFATQWISNGGDPFSLQRILGHTTMEMVNHYVRMSSADLRQRHAQVGLLDRLAARRR